MKILLISDTHDNLDCVNRLAARHDADACFHLGDLSAYTKESVQRFPVEMLLKQLQHSPHISEEEYASLKNSGDPAAMRELAIRYRTYGNFEDYLSGGKRFEVPVYAIPGNNEDPDVISEVFQHPPVNLHLLDDSVQIELESFVVYALGGAIGGEDGFQYVATAARIEALRRNVTRKYSGRNLIQLTHVPPYEAPELLRLAADLNPTLAFCGHTHHWDERVLDSGCRVMTIPKCARGHAVLELKRNQWDIRTFSA